MSTNKRNEASYQYWKKREEKAKKKYIKDEKAYQREIEKIYKNMMAECTKEINAFYAKYAADEGITIATAKRRASKLDIEAYARKAERYVSEKNFSAKANAEMKLYNMTMKVNRLELLKAKLGAELVDGFDQIDKITGQALGKRTIEELKRQAGILGESVTNTKKVADNIVNASFHNATFSEDIWGYETSLHDDLNTLLQRGLIQGKHPTVLAREIKKKFNSSRYEAERLLRTELARVQTQAAIETFKTNGYGQYEFIPHDDACKVCLSINGEVYNVDEMEIGKNAPPMHPNCRCSIAAYMDREEFEKWLNKNGESTVPAEETSDTIKPQREYDSPLGKWLGKKIYDEFMDFAEANADPGIINMWNKFINHTKVDTAHKGRGYCDHTSTIHVDRAADIKGDSWKAKFETTAHEQGHAIDIFAKRHSNSFNVANRIDWYTSSGYKGGAFEKSINDEVKKLVDERVQIAKKDFKEHPKDWDYLHEKGYITDYNYNFYKQYGSWLSGEPKYSKSMAYKMLENEIRNIPIKARGDISDMLEGATKGKVSAGIGHGKNYWKRNGVLGTEAFAEMVSANMTNPESRKIIKKYLPNSYKIFLEMVKEINKAKLNV